MMNDMKLILVVEDDQDNAELLSYVITQELHCHVRHVSNGTEALQAVEEIGPNLIILRFLQQTDEFLDVNEAAPCIFSACSLSRFFSLPLGCKSQHSDGGNHIIILWMSYLNTAEKGSSDQHNYANAAVRMLGFTKYCTLERKLVSDPLFHGLTACTGFSLSLAPCFLGDH